MLSKAQLAGIGTSSFLIAEEVVDLGFLSSDWLFGSGDGLTWFWLGGSCDVGAASAAVVDRLNLEILSFHSSAPTLWVGDNLGDRVVVTRLPRLMNSSEKGKLLFKN